MLEAQAVRAGRQAVETEVTEEIGPGLLAESLDPHGRVGERAVVEQAVTQHTRQSLGLGRSGEHERERGEDARRTGEQHAVSRDWKQFQYRDARTASSVTAGSVGAV